MAREVSSKADGCTMNNYKGRPVQLFAKYMGAFTSFLFFFVLFLNFKENTGYYCTDFKKNLSCFNFVFYFAK